MPDLPRPAKGRSCPALDGTIAADECGQKLTELACPLTCKHNPYHTLNHRRLPALIEGASEALRLRFGKSLSAEATQRLLLITNAVAPDLAPLITLQRALEHRDVLGRSLMQRWEADGWASLANDHRFILQRIWQAKIRVMEFAGRTDDDACLALDLLTTGSDPCRLLGVQNALPRFSIGLAVIYELPDGLHVHGPVIVLPRPHSQWTAREMWNLLAKELDLPIEDEARQQALWSLITRPETLEASLRSVEAFSEFISDDAEAEALPPITESLAECTVGPCDGLSLRSALNTPTHRERALEWLKHLIHVADCDEDPSTDSLPEILSALEISELDYAAPERVEEETEDTERPEIRQLAEEQLPYHLREMPPKQNKLRNTDIEERLAWLADQPPPKRPLLEGLNRQWPALQPALSTAIQDLLPAPCEAPLLDCVIEAARILHPNGVRDSGLLSIEERSLRIAYLISEELLSLEEHFGGREFNLGGAIDWVQDSPQPKLAAHLAGRVTERLVSLPEISDTGVLNAIALAKAALVELCYDVQ